MMAGGWRRIVCPERRESQLTALPAGITRRSLSVTGHNRTRPLSSTPLLELIQMSISSYNGGVVLAMRGKDCVAIASDKRLGVRFSTLAMNFSKVFEVTPHLYIGIPGLATDTHTFFQRLRFRVNLYELRENRKVTPKVLRAIVANMLYEKRFGNYFIEPVIAGLDVKTGEPFVVALDVIGSGDPAQDFALAGTCADQAFGMCETLWKPDLGPDELFETISQALMNAFDRDAISGWGGVVHIIEKDKVTTKHLRTRMD